MARRLLLSAFVALVSCGLCFYLMDFAGMIYAAATGPLNPANTPGLQSALRYVAVPISLGAGVIGFVMAFGRNRKRR